MPTLSFTCFVHDVVTICLYFELYSLLSAQTDSDDEGYPQKSKILLGIEGYHWPKSGTQTAQVLLQRYFQSRFSIRILKLIGFHVLATECVAFNLLWCHYDVIPKLKNSWNSVCRKIPKSFFLYFEMSGIFLSNHFINLYICFSSHIFPKAVQIQKKLQNWINGPQSKLLWKKTVWD